MPPQFDCQTYRIATTVDQGERTGRRLNENGVADGWQDNHVKIAIGPLQPG
jgi:hypothetical protein